VSTADGPPDTQPPAGSAYTAVTAPPATTVDPEAATLKKASAAVGAEELKKAGGRTSPRAVAVRGQGRQDGAEGGDDMVQAHPGHQRAPRD
jgi:hypothetical protein